jgi:hypothetical protein
MACDFPGMPVLGTTRLRCIRGLPIPTPLWVSCARALGVLLGCANDRSKGFMRDHNKVATGLGKGEGPEGLAGGHFEALECYYASARINRRLASGIVILRKAKEVALQSGLAGDLVIQRWAEDFPESVAACAMYSSASSSVWYPIFLGDPHYHRAPLPGS